MSMYEVLVRLKVVQEKFDDYTVSMLVHGCTICGACAVVHVRRKACWDACSCTMPKLF